MLLKCIFNGIAVLNVNNEFKSFKFHLNMIKLKRRNMIKSFYEMSNFCGYEKHNVIAFFHEKFGFN